MRICHPLARACACGRSGRGCMRGLAAQAGGKSDGGNEWMNQIKVPDNHS